MNEKGQMRVTRLLIAVMIVMLGIALLPIRCYGYYVLLKIIVCSGGGFLATKAFAVNCVGLGWWLATTAVVYNPFIRIPLGRELWVIVNIATIIMLVIFQISVCKTRS